MALRGACACGTAVVVGSAVPLVAGLPANFAITIATPLSFLIAGLLAGLLLGEETRGLRAAFSGGLGFGLGLIAGGLAVGLLAGISSCLALIAGSALAGAVSTPFLRQRPSGTAPRHSLGLAFAGGGAWGMGAGVGAIVLAASRESLPSGAPFVALGCAFVCAGGLQGVAVGCSDPARWWTEGIVASWRRAGIRHARETASPVVQTVVAETAQIARTAPGRWSMIVSTGIIGSITVAATYLTGPVVLVATGLAGWRTVAVTVPLTAFVSGAITGLALGQGEPRLRARRAAIGFGLGSVVGVVAAIPGGVAFGVVALAAAPVFAGAIGAPCLRRTSLRAEPVRFLLLVAAGGIAFWIGGTVGVVVAFALRDSPMVALTVAPALGLSVAGGVLGAALEVIAPAAHPPGEFVAAVFGRTKSRTHHGLARGGRVLWRGAPRALATAVAAGCVAITIATFAGLWLLCTWEGRYTTPFAAAPVYFLCLGAACAALAGVALRFRRVRWVMITFGIAVVWLHACAYAWMGVYCAVCTRTIPVPFVRLGDDDYYGSPLALAEVSLVAGWHAEGDPTPPPKPRPTDYGVHPVEGAVYVDATLGYHTVSEDARIGIHGKRAGTFYGIIARRGTRDLGLYWGVPEGPGQSL